MSQLFKKVACFTDLHLGLKSNSTTHNQDCEEFVDWFISTAQSNGAETCIVLGDWHNNRNAINLTTLNASIRCMEKLGQAFEKFYWFPGNHDLFYKDRRDVHSTEFGRHIPGVTIVDKITTIGDVTLVPWLIGDEWKTIGKIKSKYMFGHFELPLFMMNSVVQMPDHGELQSDHFVHQDYVFSGHFHKRQNRGKIWYIGNAFPHNFSDTWDDKRGMMIFEWGGQPVFYDWADCPKYRTINLSELLDKKDSIIKNKMHLKVNLDIDISFEEANFVKETFMNEYNVREISFIQDKVNLDQGADSSPDLKFESVDQIIISNINNIDSDQFDKRILLEIYNDL